MTDHISGELSSSMAHQYEELLRAAICKALGISDWSWNEGDIRGRVVRVITGSSEQTWVDIYGPYMDFTHTLAFMAGWEAAMQNVAKEAEVFRCEDLSLIHI